MIDEDEIYRNVMLSSYDYDVIEQAVVDLFSELNIRDFPIDSFNIAEQKGYILVPYSSLSEKARSILLSQEMSGASGRTSNGIYKIFYNDSHCIERQRFTIMHEIGHIELGHKESSAFAEMCANYYAAYSLAPSPLIGLFKCEDYIDVSIRFNISYECAIYAFNRFERWSNMPYKLKPYEMKLNGLFQ